MLIQPLLDKLAALRLLAMREGFEEQLQNPRYAELSFEERFALLVDLEVTRRENHRMGRRLKAAHFHEKALIEDLDLSATRGLPRAQVLELAQSDWVRRHLNVIVVGPTGAGKTYLACALGNAACRADATVRYERTSRLLHALDLARADGSYAKLLDSLARVQLLILDDWLRDALSASQTRDLLEILDDRYGRSSTLLSTQIPIRNWHERLADPTLADALLDRLVHNAYRIEFTAQLDSQRKLRSALPRSDS